MTFTRVDACSAPTQLELPSELWPNMGMGQLSDVYMPMAQQTAGYATESFPIGSSMNSTAGQAQWHNLPTHQYTNDGQDQSGLAPALNLAPNTFNFAHPVDPSPHLYGSSMTREQSLDVVSFASPAAPLAYSPDAVAVQHRSPSVNQPYTPTASIHTPFVQVEHHPPVSRQFVSPMPMSSAPQTPSMLPSTGRAQASIQANEPGLTSMSIMPHTPSMASSYASPWDMSVTPRQSYTSTTSGSGAGTPALSSVSSPGYMLPPTPSYQEENDIPPALLTLFRTLDAQSTSLPEGTRVRWARLLARVRELEKEAGFPVSVSLFLKFSMRIIADCILAFVLNDYDPGVRARLHQMPPSATAGARQCQAEFASVRVRPLVAMPALARGRGEAGVRRMCNGRRPSLYELVGREGVLGAKGLGVCISIGNCIRFLHAPQRRQYPTDRGPDRAGFGSAEAQGCRCKSQSSSGGLCRS
jgi:hypothetical protein